MALFETFFYFEEKVQIGHDSEGNPQAKGVNGKVREDLRIAVARTIIVFCEAFRLNSICTPVIQALESIDFARPLSDRCWKLIRWWGQLSDEVQTMRRHHTMALDTDLPTRQDFMVVGLGTLGQLIGENGELTFCKLFKDMVIDEQALSRLQNQVVAVNFIEPTFREQEQQGEEEVQEQQEEEEVEEEVEEEEEEEEGEGEEQLAVDEEEGKAEE